MKKLIMGILVVLIATEWSAPAKMRTWTDKKGNSMEAEFVKIFAGKVILKTPAGKQLKVPASGLCKADQDYLKDLIPPKIDIKVNIDIDKKKLSSGYSYTRMREKIKGTVTLTKKNPEPSSKQFTAKLYLLAKDEDSNDLTVIEKSEHKFSFEAKKTVVFTGDQGEIEYESWDSYSTNGKDGKRYEGYLVIIENDKGQMIYIDGNRSKYEDLAGKIRKTKKGSTIKF